MEIVEYRECFAEDVKDLFAELQGYLADLDRRGVLVLKEGYREKYFAFVSDEVQKHDGKLFLALKNGRAVGVVVCKIFEGGGEAEITTSCPKIGFISDLVVTEAERGQGIGHALLRRAEQYFSGKDCAYTQLEVFAPNTRAFSLYQSLGYEVNCLYLSKKII